MGGYEDFWTAPWAYILAWDAGTASAGQGACLLDLDLRELDAWPGGWIQAGKAKPKPKGLHGRRDKKPGGKVPARRSPVLNDKKTLARLQTELAEKLSDEALKSYLVGRVGQQRQEEVGRTEEGFLVFLVFRTGIQDGSRALTPTYKFLFGISCMQE